MLYGVTPYLAVTYNEAVIKEYYKTTLVKANKVRAKVAFMRYELVSSSLDYRLRIYPNGLSKTYKNNLAYIELQPEQMDYKANEDTGGIQHIMMTFTLPKQIIADLSDESDVVFICRELIDDKSKEYMPTPATDGEFRYYAIRRPGTKGLVKGDANGEEIYESTTYRTRFGKCRRIGTLMNLEDPKLWI